MPSRANSPFVDVRLIRAHPGNRFVRSQAFYAAASARHSLLLSVPHASSRAQTAYLL